MLYRVTSPIKKDHVKYEIGSEIELDDATAQKIAHSVEGPIGAEVLPTLGERAPVIFEPLPEITEEVVTEPQESRPVNRKIRKGR